MTQEVLISISAHAFYCRLCFSTVWGNFQAELVVEMHCATNTGKPEAHVNTNSFGYKKNSFPCCKDQPQNRKNKWLFSSDVSSTGQFQINCQLKPSSPETALAPTGNANMTSM